MLWILLAIAALVFIITFMLFVRDMKVPIVPAVLMGLAFALGVLAGMMDMPEMTKHISLSQTALLWVALIAAFFAAISASDHIPLAAEKQPQ